MMINLAGADPPGLRVRMLTAWAGRVDPGKVIRGRGCMVLLRSMCLWILPMNSSRGEYAVKRKPPPDPRHRYWMPEELFPSVVRSHRAVMRWRQPRSIHLCDEHGCVQLVDAGGETTRGRVPRGVSETFEVSPTGSIPRRKNPAWQVANDKVEASRTMLPCGHEAPEEKRPLTRGTVEDSRKTNRRGSQIPNQKFTGREGAAEGGTMRYLWAAPVIQMEDAMADPIIGDVSIDPWLAHYKLHLSAKDFATIRRTLIHLQGDRKQQSFIGSAKSCSVDF